MISKALKSLYPTSEFSIENENISTIRWHKNQPDGFNFSNDEEKQIKLQELINEVNRLEEEEQKTIYKLYRQKEYPLIKDQLDMLWHAMNNDESKRLEPFYSTIKSVKDQYPKS
jgi:hypothetical protein